MAQVCQGIAAFRATGAVLYVPYLCTMLAEICDYLDHTEDHPSGRWIVVFKLMGRILSGRVADLYIL
jgi:hypothetical protein